MQVTHFPNHALSYISEKTLTEIAISCFSMQKGIPEPWHTLKMKRRKLNQYSGQCDSHFLKKQFPRCINATYHQAINSPNLKEIMLDYKKRGVPYTTQQSSALPLTVMQDAIDIL